MMPGFRESLVRLVASGLYRAGIVRPLSVATGYMGRGGAFPILTYHRVNDENDPFFPALPTVIFEEQMRFVAGAYVVLPVEDLMERLGRGALPRNALAVTFDDGYRDNLTHAGPVLARYGLPATIFLATGFIGTGEVPWFDRVALAIKQTRETAWRAPWGETLPLGDASERLGSVGRVLERFKALPGDRCAQAVERLVTALGSSEQDRFKSWMLRWDDVHALSGLGCAIGAHTVTHPILSRLTADRARSEIVRSRDMIQAACGRAPRAFAYPNGKAEDYTPAVADAVRAAGFTCAVTTRFGINTQHTPPYELRRGGPWERHLPTFALKLAGYRLAGV